MRIVYLTADFGVPVLGTKGASAHVRGLVEALRAEGHDVFVLTANVGGDSPTSFPIREVPFGGALQTMYETLQEEDICKGTRLAKDLRNLLYASNLELQGRLALDEFRPDLIYERHCLFSTGGLGLARYFGIPLILEVNAPLMFEQQQMRGLALPLVARASEALVLTGADHIVAVSEVLRSYASDLGVPPERVSIVPNAADPGLFGPADGPSALKQELNWSDRFVIGFVGSMQPWHGVETLLHTLQLLGGGDSRFGLLLVGAGPRLADLRQQSEQLGLAGAVHMTGAVPHHAVPGLLRAMDLTVAPYAADAAGYFSPVKLFEYMATGLPVVAARVGQACDVIEEGRTGWLYNPGDAVELAGVIRRIASDRDAGRRVGAAARERVLRHYTWRHNARRVVRIAKELLARREAIAAPITSTEAPFDAANGLLRSRRDPRFDPHPGSRETVSPQVTCSQSAATRGLPQ